MRLAEADAAVKKKRVVGFAGRLGDGEGGGIGKIVVVADDERFKGVFGIEMQFAVGRALMSGFGSFFDWSRRGCSRSQRTSRGNFEFDLELTAGSSGKSVLQETEIIVLEPDPAEFVG